jgi:hypothetical protein
VSGNVFVGVWILSVWAEDRRGVAAPAALSLAALEASSASFSFSLGTLIFASASAGGVLLSLLVNFPITFSMNPAFFPANLATPAAAKPAATALVPPIADPTATFSAFDSGSCFFALDDFPASRSNSAWSA